MLHSKEPHWATEAAKKKAIELFKEGYFYDCVAALNWACRHTPNDFIIYANRAAALLQLEKFEEARSDCQKAIYLNKDHLRSYIRMARALIGLDELSGAAWYAEQAVGDAEVGDHAREVLAEAEQSLAAAGKQREPFSPPKYTWGGGSASLLFNVASDDEYESAPRAGPSPCSPGSEFPFSSDDDRRLFEDLSRSINIHMTGRSPERALPVLDQALEEYPFCARWYLLRSVLLNEQAVSSKPEDLKKLAGEEENPQIEMLIDSLADATKALALGGKWGFTLTGQERFEALLARARARHNASDMIGALADAERALELRSEVSLADLQEALQIKAVSRKSVKDAAAEDPESLAHMRSLNKSIEGNIEESAAGVRAAAAVALQRRKALAAGRPEVSDSGEDGFAEDSSDSSNGEERSSRQQDEQDMQQEAAAEALRMLRLSREEEAKERVKPEGVSGAKGAGGDSSFPSSAWLGGAAAMGRSEGAAAASAASSTSAAAVARSASGSSNVVVGVATSPEYETFHQHVQQLIDAQRFPEAVTATGAYVHRHPDDVLGHLTRARALLYFYDDVGTMHGGTLARAIMELVMASVKTSREKARGRRIPAENIAHFRLLMGEISLKLGDGDSAAAWCDSAKGVEEGDPLVAEDREGADENKTDGGEAAAQEDEGGPAGAAAGAAAGAEAAKRPSNGGFSSRRRGIAAVQRTEAAAQVEEEEGKDADEERAAVVEYLCEAAAIAMLKDDWAGVEAKCDAALRLDRTCGKARHLRAGAYEEQGKFKAAAADFKILADGGDSGAAILLTGLERKIEEEEQLNDVEVEEI